SEGGSSPLPRDRGDRDEEQDAEDDVEPEDRPPVRDDEDGGAEQGSEDGAELLDGTDEAERHAAASRGPEVGHQGEGGRHEPAPADALDDASGDEDVQVDGQGGHPGADDEDDETAQQDLRARDEVGEP